MPGTGVLRECGGDRLDEGKQQRICFWQTIGHHGKRDPANDDNQRAPPTPKSTGAAN
jgi:hypothetical protein